MKKILLATLLLVGFSAPVLADCSSDLALIGPKLTTADSVLTPADAALAVTLYQQASAACKAGEVDVASAKIAELQSLGI
jgi:hypothetical protein